MMYQKEPKRIVPVLFTWQKTLILVAFYSSRLRYGCSNHNRADALRFH